MSLKYCYFSKDFHSDSPYLPAWTINAAQSSEPLQKEALNLENIHSIFYQRNAISVHHH